MKKSKLMKALLVFGMSMVTATAIVGFTACDEECAHVDEDNNGKCDICDADLEPEGDGGGETLEVAVEKVELNKDELTLDIGDEETLRATVTPDTATNKVVSWTSSNQSVATVAGGKVTAKAAGTATITATAGGKTATCSVTVNAPEPKHEVTEEEWKEILESADNYTYTQTLPSMSTVNKVVGNRWQQTDGTGTVNQIIVKDEEAYDIYVQDYETKAWEKSTVSAEEAQPHMVQAYSFALGILKVCKDDYEEFDPDDGKYTAASIDKTKTLGVTLQNVVAEFDDGKLVKVTFSADGASYEINSFGSTTVDLPKIDGEDDPTVETEVTAEQWAEILESADNYTYTAGYYEIKIDGNKVEILDELYPNNGHTNQIIVKDGESYDLYEQANDVWSKTTYSAEEAEQAGVSAPFNIYKGTLKAFKDDYNSFTYSDGVYTSAETLDKSQTIGGTYENVVVKFDNGELVEFKLTESEIINGIGTTTVEIPTVGGGDVKPDPNPDELPNITTWTTVGDPIYGEVHENDGDKCYHHIFFDDSVAKKYDFDSYEVTVTLDGKPGEVIAQNPFDENVGTTHTYHLHVRIKGTKYQTAVFSITFKKDGETVATGTYTREGTKEVVLNKTITTISTEATETISIVSINGSDDLTGKKITWSISDSTIATIPENSNGSSVVVTGVAEGEAILTCTVGEGKDAFSKTCEITVVEGDVTIKIVDVTSQFVYSNKFQYITQDAVQIYCDLQGSDYAKLVPQIDPSKTEVKVSMDGGEAKVISTVPRKEWENSTLYKLWLQLPVESNWAHDYVFTINFKNANEDVVATGTYSELSKDAALYLSKDKLTLQLTEDGSAVTGILQATKTAAAEGNIAWKIEDTEGEGVATLTANEDGTYTVTAVSAGTATVTVTVGGLEKTCVVKVSDVGSGGGDQLPGKQLAFTATVNDYYGGTGNANYHDFINIAEIKDNFEYSNDKIKVSATLDGEEIAITYLRGELDAGNPNLMHFHVKIGDGTTSLDDIKSGLVITMIFIDADGQDCAYALIEN